MPAPMPLHETVAEDLPENNGGSYQDYDMEDDDDSVLHLQNEDSDQSPSSEGLQNVEFLLVQLSDMRNEVQCPICLGIIRKTRTVMECLHRFCRDCIDKSMRMGNKECPSCRTHCASRRSLRDDPNYDALIAALYPNIDQYEEEELTFHDDEDARNKQIQAAIAQTLQRQSEALTKKRKRSQTTKRRRTSYHSDDNDYLNDNSLSADERQETRPKRSRRLKGQQSPEASAGGGHNEDDSEVNRDTVAAVGGFVGSSEMLAWGRGGIRSQTRYGSAGGGNVKHSHDRISRLAEHLRNLDESHEMGIQILLVSLDVEKAPIQQPYLCCRPTLSVRQISECIAFQTSSQADEIELLAVNALHSKISSLMSLDVQPSDSSLLDACKDDLQPLNSDQTLQEVKSTFNLRQGHLILAYRHKSADPIACDEALQAMEVVSTQSIV